MFDQFQGDAGVEPGLRDPFREAAVKVGEQEPYLWELPPLARAIDW